MSTVLTHNRIPINIAFNATRTPIRTGTTTFSRPINIVVNGSNPVTSVEETNGLSAYQLAVINGFVGTVQEWLAASAKKGFAFIQTTPSKIWTVNHKLGYNPSVTCFDETGDYIIGEPQYIDPDNLKIIFSKSIAGKGDFS